MEYNFTIEQGTLASSMLPYLVHFVIAMIQGCIALQVLIWSKRIIRYNGETELLVPENLFISPKWMISKITGFSFLFIGLLLIAPLFFGWHYGSSAFALIIIIAFLLSTNWKKNSVKKLSRSFLLIGSILTFSFLIFEKEDPAKVSTSLCFKALKWRMYEQSWQEIHDINAPKVGQYAPDFSLKSTDGLDSIQLSSFKGKKPIVLIFGSYTCPPHSDGTIIMNRLYKKYKNEFEFVNVYLKEAHPIDKWWLGETNTQKAIYNATGAIALINADEPKNYFERCERARLYRKYLYNNNLPIYVDTMDDYVGEMYAAKPTRMYLIGKDGRVIYNPGFGPMAFNPKHLEKEIEKYINKNN